MSVVLYIFTPNKSYVYLLNFEPSNLVFLKNYSTEFNDITVTFTDHYSTEFNDITETFTDQNGRLLEIEDKGNLTLLINPNMAGLFE